MSITDTLQSARTRIDAVSVEDGLYYVACARTGVRPDPVAGTQFETPTDAESAARAARQYREALAKLDPGIETYDLTVYEGAPSSVQLACVRKQTRDRRANGLPRSRQSVTIAGERDEEWLQIENCPIVHVSSNADPLDDEVVARQLDAKL